jgi:hypothetical protein
MEQPCHRHRGHSAQRLTPSICSMDHFSRSGIASIHKELSYYHWNPPRVAPPSGARGKNRAAARGSPSRPSRPLPLLASSMVVARRWSWIPGSRVVVDRLVGATTVESAEAEPAGSRGGGACGGSLASATCWHGRWSCSLDRDGGAA